MSEKLNMNSSDSMQTEPSKTTEGGQQTPVQSGPPIERLSYSIHEAAQLLGVDYFSVYRLIQRKKLRACRALRGKFLVPRTELLRLLKTE